MAPFASSLVTFFLAAPLLVSAAPSRLPTNIAGLPRDATHLALDEHTREIIAFSRRGENLGRFAFADPPNIGISRRDGTASCTALSSDDLQRIPGWNTLKSTAEKNWGTGSYNVVTNDKDYPDSPANSCVSTDAVPIDPDSGTSASTSCTTQSSSSDGVQVGTSGTVSLTHSTGSSYSTTTTVTQESTISVGASVGVNITFPGVAEVTPGFSFSGQVTNTLSNANQYKVDQTTSAVTTQQNSPGKTCHLEFTTQSCSITGSGKIRMVATGWVWFEYNDKTQGHYKWALSIDSTLTNEDDRSSFIEFKSTTGATSTSDYKGVCP